MGEIKKRKVPIRKCTGCGEGFPKKELIRVVKDADGNLSIDFTGKKSGRGAYICPSAACFKKARKSGKIAKSLECSIPDELYADLEKEVEYAEKLKKEENE